jgi:hypothetical protein
MFAAATGWNDAAGSSGGNNSSGPSGGSNHHGHDPVTLRVSDLASSQRFYSELFGFVPAPGSGYSDMRIELISPLLANGFRSIILTNQTQPGNAEGLILELETAAELLDRHLLARLLHAQTTPLVYHGRTLSTSIQDPDGHRIELRATALPSHREADDPAHGTSRWDRHPSELDQDRAEAGPGSVDWSRPPASADPDAARQRQPRDGPGSPI